jgi:uncharacterized protein (TIGR02391 family)
MRWVAIFADNEGLDSTRTEHSRLIADVAQEAESLRFDSVWVTDHVIVPVHHVERGHIFYEALMTLAFVLSSPEAVAALARDLVRARRRRQRALLGHPAERPKSLLDAALKQFRNGLWRDAQLNAVMAVLELIRRRTGQHIDGDALITRTFSPNQPLLTVGDLSTQNGHDEQVGFMMVLQGVNRGTRNPRAHSLAHDLNDLKTAQYLVFASLLARRVAEATAVAPGTAPAATAP